MRSQPVLVGRMALPLLLSLSMWLGACALKPILPPEKARIPAELLLDCPIPDLLGTDNGALATFAEAARDSLVECNVDKQYLRQWDVTP